MSDVSLHYDKNACENNCGDISATAEVEVETCNVKWKQLKTIISVAQWKMLGKKTGVGSVQMAFAILFSSDIWSNLRINQKLTSLIVYMI